MDQLHLSPDLYKDFRDQENVRVSAWLRALAELGRSRRDRSQSSGSPEEMSQANARRSHENFKSNRPEKAGKA
jgi:hypothetical protein